jgi:hypothetical protein
MSWSFVLVRAEDSRRKRRARRRLPSCQRSRDGRGSQQRSSPWRRPSRSMMWRAGHMPRSHLWVTEILDRNDPVTVQ